MSGIKQRRSRELDYLAKGGWPVSEKLPILIEGTRMQVWILPERVPLGSDPMPQAKKYLRKLVHTAERRNTCESCRSCPTCNLDAISKMPQEEL